MKTMDKFKFLDAQGAVNEALEALPLLNEASPKMLHITAKHLYNSCKDYIEEYESRNNHV